MPIGDRTALVVETESVSLHVIEPDLVRTAGIGFCEDHNGGGNTRIRLEDAGGHGDHRLKPLIFDQFLSDRLVCLRTAEENAVRDDGRTATADFEHLGEQGEEEQLGLFGVAKRDQVLADVLLEHAAGERRIRHDERIKVPFDIVAAEGVLILDVWFGNAVKHHVHRADAEHGLVGIKTNIKDAIVEYKITLPARLNIQLPKPVIKPSFLLSTSELDIECAKPVVGIIKPDLHLEMKLSNIPIDVNKDVIIIIDKVIIKDAFNFDNGET